MDHKSWRWRKKPSEKTIIVSENVSVSSKRIEEETYATNKALELEQSVKDLNEKLSSALSECSTKDNLATKNAKVAEEAIAGWEKAEAEVLSFKKALDDALKHRVAAEERVVHLDAALKKCMQQLCFVREDQKQRINDAVMKASTEFSTARLALEEKVIEANNRLDKLVLDNNHLSKLLQVKEKLIEDLSQWKSQAEADFSALMERLNSIEKENTSLDYEVRMLEKELEIHNEEREFNQRSADASHRQNLESMKKIAKLETECQRLRLLVRKRLPGHAALSKMKSEVEILGREVTDTRRKKLSPAMGGHMMKDNVLDNFQETYTKRISFLVERLCGMEEENKVLKATLAKKNNELESSRIMCACTASKLSQFETQLGEISKGHTSLELVRSTPMSLELTLSSISEGDGNEDEVSCAESWASALISELEHFKKGKPKGPSCKSVGVSELSLMDDFIEMEKLAIVSVNQSFGKSHFPAEKNPTSTVPVENDSRAYPAEATGKELVLIEDNNLGFGDSKQEHVSRHQSVEKFPSWLQDILRVILQQCCATQRSHDNILEEVRIALNDLNGSLCGGLTEVSKCSSHSSALDPLYVSGFISWKTPSRSPLAGSFDGTCSLNMSGAETSNQLLESNLNESINKIIELIEGINQPSLTDYSNQQFLAENERCSTVNKILETLTGYTVRIFQWKRTELSGVLRHFVDVCNDLVHGKADLAKFASELTSTLDWIVNHCFSLQDVSSMKDTIKKHFDWDESHSEGELEVGINSPVSGAEKPYGSEESVRTDETSCYPIGTSNGQNVVAQKEKTEALELIEENRRLKDDIMNIEFGKKDLEEKLQLVIDKNAALIVQLKKLEESISALQVELASLKESKGLIEDQTENHKLLNEDLDIQLSVARVELNEARQRFSSLEVELEDKNNCYEELEAMCLELQLQLQSVPNKESSTYNVDQDQKQLRTDWEISAASEKLAECQETILNLGKQLKALASPSDAALFDKVVTSAAPSQTSHRASLLDRMLADDDNKVEELKSPKTKEIICAEDPGKPDNPNSGLLYGRKFSANQNSNDLITASFRASPVKSPRSFYGLNGTKHKSETLAGALAIVPKRHGGGGGLLRKLLMRKKREGSKKTTLGLTIM